MAWKINFWARLHDGDHAYKLLVDLLRPCVDRKTNMTNGGGTYPNLFCAHPPFQIDGNLAVVPVLPKCWYRARREKSNCFPLCLPPGKRQLKGLKVRGGGEVSGGRAGADKRMEE